MDNIKLNNCIEIINEESNIIKLKRLEANRKYENKPEIIEKERPTIWQDIKITLILVIKKTVCLQ